MGAWGTAISANDTFADVYEQFFGLYNDGLDVSDISSRLIKANKEIVNDPFDRNNFWFALTKAQWECKQLDPAIFEKVKNIIESGADIGVWRELNAAKADLKKRQLALDKFLADISIERPKAKTRKKQTQPKILPPVFAKGDCVIYKLFNGNYGGAVVLEAIHNAKTQFGNLIAATRINQVEKPVVKDFERAEILVQNFASWNNKPNIHWYYPIRHANVESLVEVIGNIKVDKEYTVYVNNGTRYGFCGDFDIWIIEQTNRQFQFEAENKKSDKVITLRSLTKVNKWKFW